MTVVTGGGRRAGDALDEALTARGLAPRSVRSYRNCILDARRWCNNNGHELDTLSAIGLGAYVASKPNTWASRHRIHCSLKHYWAIVGRDDPPLAAVRRPPKPEMVCRALEEDESRILAKAARSRGDLKGLAVGLALYGALRRSEIASLRWDAFSDDGWLTVTGKRDKTRRFPVHRRLADLLAEQHRNGSPYIFPGRPGKGPHVTPATIWSWVREVSTEAGVPTIPPHICRHIALATSNDKTGDLRATQAFAGHSDPQVTAGYTRASARRLRAVVESLDY